MAHIKYLLQVQSELADSDYDEHGMHFAIELTPDKRVVEFCLPIWLPEGTYIPGSVMAGEGGIAPIEGTYSTDFKRHSYLVAVQNGEEIYADLEEMVLDRSFERWVKPGDCRTEMIYRTLPEDIDPKRDDNEPLLVYTEQKIQYETVRAYITPLKILGIKTF